MIDFFRMTDTFFFSMPGNVVFGNGAASQAGTQAISAFGNIKKALLVTDKGVINAGLAEAVLESLAASGIAVTVFDECEPNVPLDVVRKCLDVVKREGIELIVGLGGGSSMDTAKSTSVFLTNEGDMVQYMGFNKVKKSGLPLILLPTTAGTSSEISSAIVVVDDETGDKLSAFSPFLLAGVSIIDPTLTLKMPPKLTAETGIDAFSHALEVFTNNINANCFTDNLTLQGIQLIGKHLRNAYFRGEKNLEDRYAVCMGGLIGMMGCRPIGVGIAHGVSNPVCAKYHVSHGGANALMLPAVMKFNLKTKPEKFALVADAIGMDVSQMSTMEAAEASVEGVTELITDIGLPVRLRDVGVQKEDFAEFTQVVLKRSVHLIDRGPRLLNEENIMKIYEMAY